jgi:DHA2 family multidrug resistance protein
MLSHAAESAFACDGARMASTGIRIVQPAATSQSQPAASGRRDVTEYGTRRILITVAVILAAMLEIIDTTIVNVALPYIQGNIGASLDEGAFIVTSYIVANVIVIPLSPWLQRRFGRRQYFAGSIIVFTVASLMCGFSRSLWPLVFWRFVQGAGGGGLLSQAQAILRETFPKKQQGAAQGLFAVGALFGPSIGPLMGGLLVDNLSWPWIFFVNLPIGIIAATLTILYMRNPEDPESLRLDTVGISLLAVGLGALQYVLDQGQEKDWFGDELITWLSAIALISLTAFLVWELVGTRRPAVDLRVLRYRSVWAGSVLGFVLGITLLGTLITLPQFVQGSLNFTATLSGQLLVTRALPVMLLTPLAVFLATRMRVDPRLQVGIGFACIGVSNFLLADVTTSQTDFWRFGLSLALSGIGLSQVFIPLSLVIFGSVTPPDIPKAAAFFNLSRQLGGSVATAVLITLLDRSEVSHQSGLAADATLARPVVRAYVAPSGMLSPASRNNLAGIVSGQSTVLAYADVSRFVGFITLGLTPLCLLLSAPKTKPNAASEA